ncbi:MAG: antitoxin family protein [Planctomycetes bacterium]|nr:antitoxin family protein [Planctomycetota bacterium]
MSISVEAIYENGVLKPTQALPLMEHEHVRVTVHSTVEARLEAATEAERIVRRSYGLLG